MTWSIIVHRTHDFKRGVDIVSCWMTSRDRDLAIRDNIAYVSTVLRKLRDETPDGPLAVAGFSQGTAMAYRAAPSARCRSTRCWRSVATCRRSWRSSMASVSSTCSSVEGATTSGTHR